MTVSLMAEHLGRTEDGVRWMIRHLDNPTPEHERPWTKAEKEVLHTWFLRVDSIEQVISILPWRTRNSVIRMMDRLTTPEPGKGLSRKWSADELRILDQYYPVEGIAVANRLPGRTFCAVRSTANTYCHESSQSCWRISIYENTKLSFSKTHLNNIIWSAIVKPNDRVLNKITPFKK